ncbi:MAG: oxidoreductase [Mycobacteriales bacterium]
MTASSRRSGWSAADIGDLAGRRAVVTGANGGLGFHTARELARHGAEVVLACRDEGRGAEARRRIVEERPSGTATVVRLDLADLASVRACAAQVLAAGDGLDLLVNNAGVMAIPLRRTADGFEMQFGTNHLGHFALTGLLLPALLARPGARVVTVSSNAHRIGRINFANLDASKGYHRWLAYGASKLANLLFTAELDRRARVGEVDLLALAAHPGYAATNLALVGPQMSGKRTTARVLSWANHAIAQDEASGALPSLYAATAPGLAGGLYFGPGGPLELRGSPVPVGRSRRARDSSTARRLWAQSEALTGVHFEALPG